MKPFQFASHEDATSGLEYSLNFPPVNLYTESTFPLPPLLHFTACPSAGATGAAVIVFKIEIILINNPSSCIYAVCGKNTENF